MHGLVERLPQWLGPRTYKSDPRYLQDRQGGFGGCCPLDGGQTRGLVNNWLAGGNIPTWIWYPQVFQTNRREEPGDTVNLGAW